MQILFFATIFFVECTALCHGTVFASNLEFWSPENKRKNKISGLFVSIYIIAVRKRTENKQENREMKKFERKRKCNQRKGIK